MSVSLAANRATLSLAANSTAPHIYPNSVNGLPRRRRTGKAGDNGRGTRTGIYQAHVDQRAALQNFV